MATTIGDLLMQHSQNPINNPDFRSKTDKAWASSYHSIPRTTSYTVVRDEVTSAYFDGVMLGECADDQYRKSEEAYPPNQRAWLLSTEADMSHWFHNEVSNVVLAAFKHTPTVLQASQAKPLTDESVPESVDDLYSVTCSTHRMPLVIGEMKRNIIRDAQWQAGIITSSDQQKLSRELRGYAWKYRCPQVFCFDGENLLMLQFRAKDVDDIKKSSCPVDSWVIPRDNEGGTTLRYAFYRLLVQGFRRCQGMVALNPLVAGASQSYRELFSGRSVWTINGTHRYDIPGYSRILDASSGAFYWRYGPEDQSARVWETAKFWSYGT